MSRSLQIHPDHIKHVQSLFEKHFGSQAQLAQAAGVSKDTASRFLKMKSVDRGNFCQLCTCLSLDPLWISTPLVHQFPQPSCPNDSVVELGLALDDSEVRWVGRYELVNSLIEQLQDQCRVLVLLGMTGIGKTSLALKLQQDLHQQFLSTESVGFDTDKPSFDQVLFQILGKNESSGTDTKSSCASIEELVIYLQQSPTLVILDMLESVIEVGEDNQITYTDMRFDYFLSLVTQVQHFKSRIIITSQDRIPTLKNGRYNSHILLQPLTGLTQSEAIELFQQWNLKPRYEQEENYLKRIYEAYEGHPLALRVIAGEMSSSPYQGNITAYWQELGVEVERVEVMKGEPEVMGRYDQPRIDRYSVNLADLVKTRIEHTVHRLYKQNPLACLMLCQGAVYRRAVEKLAWLLMIQDYTADVEEANWAFQMLQRRFLLEPEVKGGRQGQVVYRIHSLVRRVALDNLEAMDEEFWEMAEVQNKVREGDD